MSMNDAERANAAAQRLMELLTEWHDRVQEGQPINVDERVLREALASLSLDCMDHLRMGGLVQLSNHLNYATGIWSRNAAIEE